MSALAFYAAIIAVLLIALIAGLVYVVDALGNEIDRDDNAD